MPTVFTIIMLVVATISLGSVVLVVSALGLARRFQWLMDEAPRWWARALLATAGVEVRLHGNVPERDTEPRIYVCNHVSWFDVIALVHALRRFSFIAKAEIFRVPLFGGAAKAVGTIPIERENRKSAFESYRLAGELMSAGRNVVVFPEGTRGREYALRPFKKGPFVLAIAAHAPIVPTIIHGTREVIPRGSWLVRPGVVDVHLLPAVETEGLTYDDRQSLVAQVWQRMADALERLYGVRSLAPAWRAEGNDGAYGVERRA